jgi:hypothetical protein
MKQTFFIIIALCFLYSCKKDKPTSSNNGTVAVTIDSFPLVTGHSYSYYCISKLTDKNGNLSNTDNVIITLNLLGDTLINGQKAMIVFEKDSDYNGNVQTGRSYDQNRADGLYELAYWYNGANQLGFRKEETANDFISNGLFGLSGTRLRGIMDTLIVPDTAFYVLKFPNKVNDVWERNPIGNFAGYKKIWQGYKTISTNAGVFNCAKLQAFVDFNNNNLPDDSGLVVYQYFSDKGLIEQDETFTNGLLSNGDTINIQQTTVLTHVNF